MGKRWTCEVCDRMHPTAELHLATAACDCGIGAGQWVVANIANLPELPGVSPPSAPRGVSRRRHSPRPEAPRLASDEDETMSADEISGAERFPDNCTCWIEIDETKGVDDPPSEPYQYADAPCPVHPDAPVRHRSPPGDEG